MAITGEAIPVQRPKPEPEQAHDPMVHGAGERRKHKPAQSRILLVYLLLTAGAASCAAQLPAIQTTSLPIATTDGPYSVTLAVTGGSPPYSNWTVGAGSLPPGLTLNASTGTISGVPSVDGTYNFFVTVQDSAGGISPAVGLSIVTSFPSISTTSALLPNVIIGAAYSFALVATGGTPPYANWTVTAGSLPQGLFMNPSTGTISGTPIAVGVYNFSVTVQDSVGVTSSPQTLTMVAGVAIITNTLPKATLTGTYNSQLAAGGGVPPYVSWTISAGVLPPGLVLVPSTGLITGIPTATGSYSFSVTVTDSVSTASTPQPYTIVVANVPAITTGALPPALPGVPYSVTLSESGGSSPVVWAIASGNLPAGLSFFPGTGVISGTPQSAAGTTFNFSVQVTDAVGVTSGVQPLSIAINQATLTLSPTSLTFSATPGDTAPPPVQSLSIFSLAGPVTFTATVATATGGNWLSVTSGGRTPGSILVSVSTGGLAPSTTYHGTITIAGQNVAPATVPVTLAIGAGGAPQLSLTPASLALSYVQGNGGDQRYVVVNNSGGGTVHFNAQATTSSCGTGWLSLLTNTGSATSSSPGVIPLYVNPAGLSDKSCGGTIAVTDSASGQSQNVSVTMNVSSQQQSLVLTQSGMNFQTAAAFAPPSQAFAVLNTGVGTVSWTATPQIPGGGSWLSVTPATGTSTEGVLPTPLTVSLASQGLPPGQYNGTIQVASSMLGNSQPVVSVFLTVLNGPPSPPPLTPSGVILLGQSSGLSELETVTMFNPWNAPLTYNSTVVTDDRVSWLTQTPASGTIAAGASATMTLQANLKGLTGGLQHGVVRVVFTDGTVHTVDVYLIVPVIATSANGLVTPELTAEALVQPESIAEACPGGTGIAVVLRSPEPNFQVTAQVPVPLQLIAKDCKTGKAIRQAGGASAQVMFSSSDAPITLIDDGAGNWTGTWMPTAATPQIYLTARIDEYVGASASVVSGQDTLQGIVNPPPGGTTAPTTGVTVQ